MLKGTAYYPNICVRRGLSRKATLPQFVTRFCNASIPNARGFSIGEDDSGGEEIFEALLPLLTEISTLKFRRSLKGNSQPSFSN